MARDDPQFNFRMTYETKEKLKQRAKMNGRSINAELMQILVDALEKPTPISGYRNDAEKLADHQAEEFKRIVFNTLIDMYSKEVK
ncbi:Arc family DNA-binding protein [Providencia rettgeri]|uniref:Arc family DNA-binding protein n=1 Tax=Providencia rettgeri TaxID=587 RepID=UPI00155E5345|nr:Arc family DNA-binding protein [Providencia rettgeri]QKG44690.1 Arc family DNA-binding protein [Providencia rettgeri]QNN34823.1 Arc family DNA-binding protein [Providencia rettgeri]